MNDERFSNEFLIRLQSVTHKRAKIVIEHILEHGYITTEELETTYGYKHPPRAARDVRERGIPLESFNVKSTDGKTITAYRFGDISQIRYDRLAGRQVLPKRLKLSLLEQNASQCSVCLQDYEPRYLQIDHRIPYEIAGDIESQDRSLQDYMLLCGSCNRSKSWACEHCLNWLEAKDISACQQCYWASPGSYEHIALDPIRRLDIVWQNSDLPDYEAFKERAALLHEPMSKYAKHVIKQHLLNNAD